MSHRHHHESSSYQSPISIEPFNHIHIDECIKISGKNRDACYNDHTKNFKVKSQVVVKINSKTYKLVEYHFHVPSEHIINGKRYPSEIHYVFIEYNDDESDSDSDDSSHSSHGSHASRERHCACCSEHYDKNLLVIGRTIKCSKRKQKLKDIQVKIPHTYYEYDGTLTTGELKPVRWIIGKYPIYLNIKQIECIAKPARPIQELDGRIILLSS
jgi:carbonic anhydrase